jgi:uncharacterized protein
MAESFGERLKAALRAARDANDPARFAVEGQVVTCSHCRGDDFAPGEAQLNTAGMTFLDLDWANRSAYTLMCTNCGHIEWFGQSPDRI